MHSLHIDISPGTGTAIYRQIVEQVRLAVATGAVEPGYAMPSVRGLAEALVVNPNTVARAYGELSRDGVLEARQGRGVYVAQKRQVYSLDERRRRLRQALDAFVHEALFLDFTEEQVLSAVDEKLKSLKRPAEAAGGSQR